MCEFCHKHGEGKKWYLLMENYSKELFERDDRKKFMYDFFDNFEEKYGNSVEEMEKLQKAPKLVQKVIRSISVPKYKRNHFGQVVPIDDLEKIISMLGMVVRIPCICRKITLGKEVRYCFGLGASIHGTSGIYSDFPDFFSNFEVLKKDEAIKVLHELDQKGLVHSVWTFKTPFIGGICNCDEDCLGYKSRVHYQLPIFFKAEYVAKINWDKCSGCKSCKMVCQFGAVLYSASNEKCSIDIKNCFGCGVCRAVCPNQAITLDERVSLPSLVKEW
jgi:NAD-dependent dihydropyrimidine dehydrogenase PreA subunit